MWRKFGVNPLFSTLESSHFKGFRHLSVHAAHVRCRRCCRRSRLLDVGNQRFGRQNRGRNGGSVLQRGARDLRRVDDAFFEHIAVGVGQRVVAVADGRLRLEVLDEDGALDAGVRRDLADRLLERLQNDRRAGLLVALNGLDIRLDSRDRVDERGAAACNDAFLDSRLRRCERVLDAELLLLHLGLGRCRP